MITSCREMEQNTEAVQEVENISVKADSCSFTVFIDVSSNITDNVPGVHNLDLLVYDEDGVGSLESWTRFNSLPDSIVVIGTKRAKTVVAIANSPRSFSRAAIERYDSIRLLSYDFDEDSPEAPLMSGTCSLVPDRPGHISLIPLMSRVLLCEVSNTMKGYARLEDPRIYLENMNAAAEILRNSDFRPSEVIDAENKVRLPYDIGLFSQQLGIPLYCFPNESPESTVGSPQTVFVLECEIHGNTCRFPVTLNGLGRNKTLRLDIAIAGPELYDCKVY